MLLAGLTESTGHNAFALGTELLDSLIPLTDTSCEYPCLGSVFALEYLDSSYLTPETD